MKPQIAFFDVDGTVIASDSFLHLARWRLQTEPWRILLLLVTLPVFIATYFFNLDRRGAKSALLWSLTVFKSKRATVRMLSQELPERLCNTWFVEASSVISELRRNGVHICYVSASGQIWIRGLLARCDGGMRTVIGSKLGFRFGGVMMTSPNCYREEKLNRIGAALGTNFEASHAFSDHPADIPMLTMANERTIVSPRAKNLSKFENTLKKPYRVVTWHSVNSQKE
jgi:phosphatidylglycerophosphatase C